MAVQAFKLVKECNKASFIDTVYRSTALKNCYERAVLKCDSIKSVVIKEECRRILKEWREEKRNSGKI